MKHRVIVFLLILWIVECVGCGCRRPVATTRPALPAATTQPAAKEPAIPFWLYLRFLYPHRTMESPFATPRDFEEQA